MTPDVHRDNIAALRREPLFSGLSDAELDSLADRAQRRRYRSGEAVFHKDDPGAMLYILVGGLVKITLPSEEGHEAVLALVGAGEMFGELALLDGQPRSASAVAMETSEALTIRREDFLEFLKDHADASISIIAMLSRRLRNTNDLIADTLFLDTPTRIAKKLLDLAADFGKPNEDGITIDLRLRQQDMASMVGASRESVNRCLILLEQRGIIRLDTQRITIVRPDDLGLWIAGPPQLGTP